MFSEGVGGRVTTAAVHLMDTHGRMLSFSAAAALYSDGAPTLKPGTSLRRMAGITGEIEEVLRQRKIKSKAWIADAFYHEDSKPRMISAGLFSRAG